MRSLFGLIVLASAASAPAAAEDHAVGVRVGLLGVGVEYAHRLSDRISVRGGVNGSGLDYDATESGIDYRFDLDFDSIAAGVDVYPLKGAFRVSAGLLRNDSSLSATSTATDSVTVGDREYPPEDIGTLRGSVGFGNTAPYVGVGWDWLREKKLGMALELGFVKQGSPDVSLTADGPIADDPAFAEDLAAERAELESSLDKLDLYPYLMLGLVVRF